MALDSAKWDAAIRAGRSAEMFAYLEARGHVIDDYAGPRALRLSGTGHDYGMALDAQPELATQPNAGIPAFLSNWVDPKVIRTLFSPLKAAEIAGEMKKGDWLTTVATFLTVEATGETSAYGDFNSNGNSDINTNFPQRQSFHYQTFVQWGQKEIAIAGLARLDQVSEKNIAAALVLNKFQNLTYFFGVAGLQCYGLLNDPALYAPIAPTAAWNLASTAALTVYEDIRRMFVQLQQQSDGVIENDTAMTLAMSNTLVVALNKTDNFNVNVLTMLKTNFPTLTIKTAVEYSTQAGQLVQLIVDSIDGQETVTAAFTEKMRAHAVVTDSSSWKQKLSQGTFGTILFRPYAIAQLIGA